MRALAVAVLAVLLGPGVGWGEDGAAIVCGRVLKVNGKPARKAEIGLIEAGRGTEALPDPRWIKTDRKGRFCFSGTAPGRYLVMAEYHRFDYLFCAYQPLVVSPGRDQAVEMKLELCSFPEIVEPPVVDPRETSLTTTITLEQLQNIPGGSGGGR